MRDERVRDEGGGHFLRLGDVVQECFEEVRGREGSGGSCVDRSTFSGRKLSATRSKGFAF